MEIERRFGNGYREEVVLRDGRRARIQPLRREHAPALRRGFERLSDASRFLRFFAVKRTLSARELAYLTDLDGESHFALAAAVRTPDGWDGAAVARFVRLPDDPAAVEPALTVVDDYQGVGLGSLLFDRLVVAACERGYARLRAEVLRENRAMLAILGRAGEGASTRHRHGIVEVAVDLGRAALPAAA